MCSAVASVWLLCSAQPFGAAVRAPAVLCCCAPCCCAVPCLCGPDPVALRGSSAAVKASAAEQQAGRVAPAWG